MSASSSTWNLQTDLKADTRFRPGDAVVINELERKDMGKVQGSWVAKVITAHLKNSIVVSTDGFPEWARDRWTNGRANISVRHVKMLSKVSREDNAPDTSGKLATMTYREANRIINPEHRKHTPTDAQRIKLPAKGLFDPKKRELKRRVIELAEHGTTQADAAGILGVSVWQMRMLCKNFGINFPVLKRNYLTRRVHELSKQGLTQRVIAERLGIGYSTVGMYAADSRANNFTGGAR